MKTVKKWGKLCVIIVLLSAAAGTFLWYTSRPALLDPAKLTLAETYESCPGTALALDITNYQMTMVLENHSDIHIESGAAVDADRALYEIPGLDILLDGIWYKVPSETYSTAGVGLILAPGDSVEMKIVLSPYGELPDGQYRLSYSYVYYDPAWERAVVENPDYAEYTLYARFDIANRKYVPV